MLKYLKRLHRRLRAWGRHDREPPSLLGLDIPLHEVPIPDPLSSQRLRARLGTMPEIVRETYLLRMVDGMTIAEIATLLGVSRRAVRKRLRIAIKILTMPTAEL